jgi:protein-disulfide isomerase
MELLIRMPRLDLTKDPYAEVMKRIDIQGRPIRGNKDAKVVAVNYDDFECQHLRNNGACHGYRQNRMLDRSRFA